MIRFSPLSEAKFGKSNVTPGKHVLTFSLDELKAHILNSAAVSLEMDADVYMYIYVYICMYV